MGDGERRTNAIIGAGALLVIILTIYGMALFLGGAFKSGYEVTATFARAGQLLRNGSDVKMRGVLVGSVRDVDITRTGTARVEMLLDESQDIPDNVNAAIRAKTLFGEKYIDLVIPAKRSDRRMAPGDEIPQDRTIPPIEVETILEKGVPILEAIDPEAFGAALHALAQGVVGNEDELRRATVQSEKLLTETERTLPNLERNLVHLKNFASAVNQSDTDLLNALDGLSAVGEVIRDNPDEFRRTISSLVPLARDLGDLFTAREGDLGDLAGKQRAILDEVAERANKLPALVKVLDSFLTVWVLDLSEGPYWRIAVTDPPIVLGEPYAPGEEPTPRSFATVTAPPGPTSDADLTDLLLGPLAPQADRRLDDLDRVLTPLREGATP
jgi:virulence factor Mce-like protein